MIKLLIPIFALLLIASASAANWQYSGVGDIYFDKDSQKREGDMGTIEARESSQPSATLQFDCKRAIWFAPPSPESHKVDENIKTTYEAACKKKYEFWK